MGGRREFAAWDVGSEPLTPIKRIAERFFRRLRLNWRPVLVSCVALIEVFLNFGRIVYPGDSNQYIAYALFFLHKGGYVTPLVVMRPMVPFFAAALNLVFSNLVACFGVISGFFWVLGAVVAYKLGQLFLGDRDLAVAVGLSFATAPIVLLTGASVLTDSAGFFFIGLTVFLCVKRQAEKEASRKAYFLDALVCSFGVFFKESVAFALLFMLAVRLWKRKGFLESFVAMLLVGLGWLAYLGLFGFGFNVLVMKFSVAQQMPHAWNFKAYVEYFVTGFVTGLSLPKPYFLSAGFWLWVTGTLTYAVFVLGGLAFSKGKRGLWTVLLFLFPVSIVWPDMSSRFSFSMWPAVIPSVIGGMQLMFSRLGLHWRAKSSFNYKFLIFFYVCLLAAVNTASVLAEWGSLTIPRM